MARTEWNNPYGNTNISEVRPRAKEDKADNEDLCRCGGQFYRLVVFNDDRKRFYWCPRCDANRK